MDSVDGQVNERERESETDEKLKGRQGKGRKDFTKEWKRDSFQTNAICEHSCRSTASDDCELARDVADSLPRKWRVI